MLFRRALIIRGGCAAIRTAAQPQGIIGRLSEKHSFSARRGETAIAKGVETNARARMTDDCKKGIAKFLEK